MSADGIALLISLALFFITLISKFVLDIRNARNGTLDEDDTISPFMLAVLVSFLWIPFILLGVPILIWKLISDLYYESLNKLKK